MSPELLEQKLRDIDARMALERAAAEYLCAFIEEHEDKLRAAFAPDATEDDNIDAILYDQLQKAFYSIARLHTRVIGVSLYSLVPNEEQVLTPRMQLGWTRYVPALPGIENTPTGETFPHIEVVTEAGLEVVNGYRAAIGWVTLEEQRAANHDAADVTGT